MTPGTARCRLALRRNILSAAAIVLTLGLTVPIAARSLKHTGSAARNVSPAVPHPESQGREVFALEDTLARAFERRRAETHLRRLARIDDRPLLRQLTCSAAVTGIAPMTPLALEAHADNALFTIAAPEDLPPAMRRVADYDDRRTASGRHVRRYSVAVFRSSSAPVQFWVGVALYWGPFTEWFALRSGTYTHAVAARAVVPACADIR